MTEEVREAERDTKSISSLVKIAIYFIKHILLETFISARVELIYEIETS